jgi:hypothetical protein
MTAPTSATRSTASTLMQAIDGSLKRCSIEYVDLVFCHRPDPDTPIEETVWAMHDMIRQGKALYWGTSEWSADQIMQAWQIAERHHLRKPQMEQPQYHMFHRERVEERVPPASTHDIGLGLTTWSPLASGLLTGKYNWAAFRRTAAAVCRAMSGCAIVLVTDEERLTKVRGCSQWRPIWAVHIGPACTGLVRQESQRQHRDHRRQPRRTGAREYEGAGSVPNLTAEVMARSTPFCAARRRTRPAKNLPIS